MTLFVAFGLGFLIAANLLLVTGLAAYHFTVTTKTSEKKEPVRSDGWLPQHARQARKGRYQARAIPVATHNATRRNSAG